MQLNKETATIALAGNPNVGKSTVFNALTGMHQHTGNWPGKTVAKAEGKARWQGQDFCLVDLPGVYSLSPHSAEEEITRDFLCLERYGAVIIVCDATCLERNLCLALQILELTGSAVLCLNLSDEARRKGLRINVRALSRLLRIPVVTAAARDGAGMRELLEQTAAVTLSPRMEPYVIPYPPRIEEALSLLEPIISREETANSRWLALRLLEDETQLAGILSAETQLSPLLTDTLAAARQAAGGKEKTEETILSALTEQAAQIYREAVSGGSKDHNTFDGRMDRLLTGKISAYPTMLLLLAAVFWLTLSGANYPSRILSDLLLGFENTLAGWFAGMDIPPWIGGMLVNGVYRVMAWVVSVMLPPMAIFFPLFTLLEDVGYLPRVAFNLDKHFQRCRACGKQALTMMMGFGCNAAGVTGCRIIDSPRERLIAIITNCFVPCNGRFPALMSLSSIFFLGLSSGAGNSALAALLLTAIIVFAIGMTFAASRFLSATILKGIPSAFTLELPPYRRPQIGKTLVRSLCDRTLFILARAVKAAAPAGLIIWLMANIQADGASLLWHASSLLDPLGRALGMDGVILLAFILGLPANEIVLPLVIMGYTCGGTIVETGSLAGLQALLAANGWTWVTAACTIIFFLIHWPCATTIMTIRKETASRKWTAAAVLLPTLWGAALCFIFNSLCGLFN